MKAIVAMDPSRVIGYKGKIPWPKISEDMRWFKWLTRGLPYQRALELSQFPLGAPEVYESTWGLVVMGNTTYSEVGILPNRVNFVLTNDPMKLALPDDGGRMFADYKGILNLRDFSHIWNHSWVIGGAKTYTLFLPFCTEVFVTHILDDYEGDSFFPPHEHLFPNSQIIKEHRDYWIVRYSK